MNKAKQQVRAACYCRISSDPKDKREGVDRQRDDTAALCEVKGWQVADVYVDNDRSASNGKVRPAWDRLLADIRAGKVDAVAAWDQDRVNRMMDDFIAYKGLFVERGILLATSNNGDIDLSTPSGVLTATIKTAVAEHEVAMMKVRMRRAGRQRAERGIPKWKVAFGYKLAPNDNDDGTREKDPKTAKLIRDAYKAVLRGATITEISTLWNDDPRAGTASGKAWTPSLVSQLLRSPRNAGLRTHTHNCRTLGHGDRVCSEQGKLEVVGKGTWPPLIDEQTWRSAVSALDGRPGASQRQPYRKHLLSGLLNCGKEGCGGHLIGQRNLDHEVVYVCKSCHGCSVREKHVEPLVFGVVAGRLAMSDAKDLLKSELHDSAEAERLRAERKTLVDRHDEIARERAEGLIDGNGYRVMVEHIQSKVTAIDARQLDQDRLRLFDDIPLGTPEVADKLRGLSRDRLRAIMDTLVTITVRPVGKGHRANGERFDHDRVHFDWHQ
jgi:DNA invertase Pin-like site-specific DNA recombinase